MHEGQRDALRDIGKYLTDMSAWCDQDGRFDRGMISVSTESVNRLRHTVDLILRAGTHGALVEVPEGYSSIYAYLCHENGASNG